MSRPFSVLLTLPLFCVLTTAFTQVLAQTKVGYLDASKLLKRMPEAIDAQSRLDQLVSGWTHDAQDMQNELNRKQSDFDRRKLIMADAERTAADVDLQGLRKKLDDFRHSKYDTPNGELFSQEAQLMKPAYDRLAKAIEDVALDGKYDYVMDRSSRDVVMLYSNSKYDLTITVAHKLGIEVDVLSTPLVNKAPNTNPGAPSQQPGQVPQTQFPRPNPGEAPPTPGATMQNPPPFNTGGYNPDQQPPPPTKPRTEPSH